MALTPSMGRLVQQLTRLPGIGEKTAGRLAFWILRADREYAQALASAIVAVKDETRLCSVCFALTEADPCPICTDPTPCGNALFSDHSAGADPLATVRRFKVDIAVVGP